MSLASAPVTIDDFREFLEYVKAENKSRLEHSVKINMANPGYVHSSIEVHPTIDEFVKWYMGDPTNDKEET